MSWTYAGSYYNRQFQALAALSSATDIDYFKAEDWIRHIPTFSIYGIADAAEMSPLIAGDQGWPKFRPNDYFNNVAISGIFKDPKAVWFTNRMAEAFEWLNDDLNIIGRIYRILW